MCEMKNKDKDILPSIYTLHTTLLKSNKVPYEVPLATVHYP